MLQYIPQLEIDWEDFDAIRILADAEEEQGNYNVSIILQWIAGNRLTPHGVDTATFLVEMDEHLTPTYDWNKLYETHYEGYLNSRVYAEIFDSLPISTWVNYGAYTSATGTIDYISKNAWRSFISKLEAYTALIETCIYLIDTKPSTISYFSVRPDTIS